MSPIVSHVSYSESHPPVPMCLLSTFHMHVTLHVYISILYCTLHMRFVLHIPSSIFHLPYDIFHIPYGIPNCAFYMSYLFHIVFHLHVYISDRLPLRKEAARVLTTCWHTSKKKSELFQGDDITGLCSHS